MPIELSMPLNVSATRGVGLPARHFGETLLITSAPRRFRSSASRYSIAKQPDAGITGLRRIRSPTRTVRLDKIHLPDHVANGKHGPLAAHAKELLVAIAIEHAHTRQANAHAAGHAL